ncbi:MAG TPA: FAD-dependent monooxygenase [Longimicrobiales bacterium]|nr:FAD-dependent monooxygenase [Longimicrobiales bacterium]
MNGRAASRDHGNSGADAIVVGAGPAGAVTALLLARAGHDVLILERATLPRPKPCGDCLSAGAAAVLHRLGLLAQVAALPHARLRGWRIAAPAGAVFAADVADPPGYAMTVERALLDEALARSAVTAGARLREGVRVTDVLHGPDGAITGVRTDGGDFHSRLVVGADGLRSVVARRLRAVRRRAKLRKVSFTFHVDRPLHEDAVGEMHVGDGVCLGIAPVVMDGSRFNLTVVADSRRFGRQAAADPAAFAVAAAAALPASRRSLSPAGLGLALASGPFDQPVRQVTFDGAALAGDAAGYYDPFTGQGVTHALLSAELLARTADGALRRRDCSAAALQPYDRALRSALRAPRLLQRTVEAVLSRPAVADRAVARLARAHRTADALIAVIGMTAPATSLLTPSVFSDLFGSLLSGRLHDHQG